MTLRKKRRDKVKLERQNDIDNIFQVKPGKSNKNKYNHRKTVEFFIIVLLFSTLFPCCLMNNMCGDRYICM